MKITIESGCGCGGLRHGDVPLAGQAEGRMTDAARTVIWWVVEVAISAAAAIARCARHLKGDVA